MRSLSRNSRAPEEAPETRVRLPSLSQMTKLMNHTGTTWEKLQMKQLLDRAEEDRKRALAKMKWLRPLKYRKLKKVWRGNV